MIRRLVVLAGVGLIVVATSGFAASFSVSPTTLQSITLDADLDEPGGLETAQAGRSPVPSVRPNTSAQLEAPAAKRCTEDLLLIDQLLEDVDPAPTDARARDAVVDHLSQLDAETCVTDVAPNCPAPHLSINEVWARASVPDGADEVTDQHIDAVRCGLDDRMTTEAASANTEDLMLEGLPPGDEDLPTTPTSPEAESRGVDGRAQEPVARDDNQSEVSHS